MIRSALHRFVLATRGTPLREAYRAAYLCAARAAASGLAALPGVEGVLLHRGLSRPGWEPGVSDIDLILLRRSLSAAEEPDFLARLSGRYRRLRGLLPMTGDLWVAEPEELSTYLERGGLRSREDSPRWSALRGGVPPLPPSLESASKRRLDPWTWALTSCAELSRRVFASPARAPAAKAAADRAKLFADVLRFAEAAAQDRSRPASREEALARLDGELELDGRELWVRASVSVARSAAVVLARLAGPGRADAAMPRAADGPSRALLERLLAEAPAARAAVLDLPYHATLLLDEEAAEGDFQRAARSLEAASRAAVPLALTPSGWALALQSPYLGASLGWLDRGGAGADTPAAGATQGLFRGWGAGSLGRLPQGLPLLPEGLRWEAAAEAASWMALWWRFLWASPAYPNRFALFHLYTRSLGLRLALAGHDSGPFCDLAGLARRSERAFPAGAAFYASLRDFCLREPGACVDSLARADLAPEHAAALAELAAGLVAAVRRGSAPIPCPSASR